MILSKIQVAIESLPQTNPLATDKVVIKPTDEFLPIRNNSTGPHAECTLLQQTLLMSLDQWCSHPNRQK